jgi:hypothetical protein
MTRQVLHALKISAVAGLLGALCATIPALAKSEAPFDLPGPRIEIKVTRGDRTLPISQVPNLRPGDRMWLHPLLPKQESIHYLLISVFLRGSLNPPPDDWFTKVETWKSKIRKSGVDISVPSGANEALIFWAPDTGGGFNTVRGAVRARPGVFVRAAQDLYAANLTRSRLDAYIESIKRIAADDPSNLKRRAKALSQSLYLQINNACFDLPIDQQESCLIRNPSSVVLNDTQSQSMVTALTTGSTVDMINHMSSSSALGGGAYSPYIGAVVDMVRIMGSMHTANYMYIPALETMKGDQLDLKLSSPPSFSNPKSVMVSSLPPVTSAQFPLLHAVHPEAMLCLERPSLVLSVGGAPLVFSTAYAHDMILHVEDASGHSLDLPASADPQRGGFLVDARKLSTTTLTGTVTGELRGEWGFDAYRGPSFTFTNSRPQSWAFADGGSGAITASDKASVKLRGESVACVKKVSVVTPQGQDMKTDWERNPPRLLEVNLPVTRASRGLFHLAVAQYGQKKPDTVPVHVYPPSAVITGLTLHAGDTEADVVGTRLDEIASISMAGIDFDPGPLHRKGTKDKLRVTTKRDTSTNSALAAGAFVTADVHLKDGRVLQIPVTVAPSRPRVKLLSKSIVLAPNSGTAMIRVGADGDLPQYGHLTFFLKSVSPKNFPRDEKIEIAAADGGFDTTLSVADRTLTLQDAQTVLAVLDPAKAFGSSAFGPLRFRPVTGDGVDGDWQPLTNLVRLPSLREVRCPDGGADSCTLSGSDLFLIDSISNTKSFTRSHSVSVPLGFAGTSMKVPRPIGTTLYLKLRDDPATVDEVSLPVLPETYASRN